MLVTQAISRKDAPSAWSAAQRSTTGLARGSWVVVDQGIVSLASFLSAVIVGRVGGPEQMGIYGLAMSIFWLAASIPHSLVWTPYTSRAPSLTSTRRACYADSATVHAVLLAVAFAAILLVLGLVPLPIGNARIWFVPMCLALVPFVVTMILREHVRRINLAHLQTRDLLAFDVPVAIVQVSLLGGLAYWGLLSSTTALIAISVASSGALLWLCSQRTKFRFSTRLARIHWANNRQFGGWILLVSIVWLMGDTSYRWLVGSLRGIDALGEFTAAQSIVLAINPFFLAISNFARATAAITIASEGYSVLRRNAVLATFRIGLGAGAAYALLALLGGPAVRLVFGESFSGQGAVIASLALGMFAHSLMIPMDAALAAMQRGRAMFVASVVRTAIIVATGIPLVWWRGTEGVGYSIAVGCTAAAMVQWFAFARLSCSRDVA